MGQVLTRSQCAKLTGVSTKAILHYEKLALISPIRSTSGYRLYNTASIVRLYQIKQLKMIGLPLKKIAELLTDANNQNWLQSLEEVKTQTRFHIKQLTEQLEHIERLISQEQTPATQIQSKLPSEVEEILNQCQVIFSNLPPEKVKKYLSFDRQLFSLLLTLDWPEETKQQIIDNFKQMLAYPELVIKSTSILDKFEALSDQAIDSPDVLSLCQELQLTPQARPLTDMEKLFYMVLTKQLGTEISAAQQYIISIALGED